MTGAPLEPELLNVFIKNYAISRIVNQTCPTNPLLGITLDSKLPYSSNLTSLLNELSQNKATQ